MMQALLHLEDINRFDHLELLARQVVEGFIIGLHKSPFHGFSAEFAEHRLYNPGESVKNIDWKVYARTDRMYVKRFEEETNLRCQVVIDTSSSMYYPLTDSSSKGFVNKLHFSVLSAAAIMHMLKKQRDAVGLTLFSDDLDIHTKAKSSTVHHKLLLSYLEQRLANPDKTRPTKAADCLHLVAESIPRRSLVVLFSDMFEAGNDPEELFAALKHLKHCKHEVILFHVTDKQYELEFNFDNRPYLFVDIETGEKVRLQAAQIRDFYTEKMGKFIRDLKLRCGQFHIDFIEADIRKDFRQVLLPYLVKRTKMK